MISFMTEKQRNETITILKEALEKSIISLDENKRYLLLIREENNAKEVAEAIFEGLKLGEVKNVKLVIVSGDVKLLEF